MSVAVRAAAGLRAGKRASPAGRVDFAGLRHVVGTRVGRHAAGRSGGLLSLRRGRERDRLERQGCCAVRHGLASEVCAVRAARNEEFRYSLKLPVSVNLDLARHKCHSGASVTQRQIELRGPRRCCGIPFQSLTIGFAIQVSADIGFLLPISPARCR